MCAIWTFTVSGRRIYGSVIEKGKGTIIVRKCARILPHIAAKICFLCAIQVIAIDEGSMSTILFVQLKEGNAGKS